jgi:CheY-like chemotaxis protein
VTARVLFVDDEPNLLTAIERTLGFEHDLLTATSGDDALARLASDGPFAVVVSDMRMPRMSGAELLARVRTASPDTTRVLLTGHAEVSDAAAAVNRGHIFRFLTKPCPGDVLRTALDDAIAEHRRRVTERELLEQTVAGATRVLTDVLAMSSPEVFARSQRVAEIARHLLTRVTLAEAWAVELAARLCYLGVMTLPDGVLTKAYAGHRLTAVEQTAFDGHPAAGAALVEMIPRLGLVAALVRYQRTVPPEAGPEVRAGAHILQIAIEVDRALWRGATVAETITSLRGRHPSLELLAALASYQPATERAARPVRVGELRPGMVIERDVTNRGGVVIVTRGALCSPLLIERLRRFASDGAIGEALLVRPAQELREP